MLSPFKEPRKRFTRKKKGKKKMSEYATGRDKSDRSEFDFGRNEDGPLGMKSESAKRALQLANTKLRQSTPRRTPSKVMDIMST